MTYTAKPVVGAVVIKQVDRHASTTCLTTTCPDYDAYKALPDAVEFGGAVFGKTGWNSDRGDAYYKSDAMVAMPQ